MAVLIAAGGAANIYRTTSATEQPGDGEEANNLARLASHDPESQKEPQVSEKQESS